MLMTTNNHIDKINDKININEIFENAKKDPTLFSTMNIEELLNSIENEKNDYLENKTMDDIIKQNFETISELDISLEDTREICNRLIGYRYVDEIHELHKGKHIRWIRINKTSNQLGSLNEKMSKTPVLTNGGILVNIKFLDNGVHIICKNSQNRFIQYKFDDSITFQKLSVEEQLLLMAYENIGK
jgi:replicative superfamily II helicase